MCDTVAAMSRYRIPKLSRVRRSVVPLAIVTLVAGCAEPSLEHAEEDLKARPPSQVELKITVKSNQIDKARAGLKLVASQAERREVFFYDTHELALFERGVILRARKKLGAKDDSTVKLRPLTAGEVEKSWFAMDGFKCEVDSFGNKSVESCSLTSPQDSGEIDEVRAGGRAIKKLYAATQELFLADYAETPAWNELEVLGPVAVQAWQLHRSEVASDVNVELWTLPDGARVLEVSTRASVKAATARLAELTALLKKLGLDASGAQETKTKAALTFFTADAP